MLNPFELIPKTLDPTIRQLVVVLIAIQLLAFFLYMILMIYTYIKNKKVNTDQIIEGEIDEKKTQ
jgi:hypothetical protein